MAQVELQNINKIYPGNIHVVKDVNISIQDKEFVVLVGPSGCGKTTTLRMIAGLEDISSGILKIDGHIMNDVAPKDRNIAMVFQNYALYPHMTVYDNMAFGLKIRKFSKDEIEQRITEAAQILELEHLLKRKPKALSGGQRQRVAVGRAIVRHPKVFLFDEPLSNLDAKLRVQMRAEISSLHQRLAATMVYVTHDQVEAMTMGDKIVIMRDGVIQQIGSPLELYNMPTNRFVAGFIGSPPMNFITVTVNETDGKLYVSNDNVRLDISDISTAKALKNYAGRSVYLGVRAEDLQYQENTSIDAVFKVVIEVIEPLGAETHIYVKSGTSKMIARIVPNIQLVPQQEISLVPDLNKLLFFDFETEILIS